MAIDHLIIENFKGIAERAEIEIKPITLIIGPNSSGKSSIIHALACLSQTAKLPNNTRHLILDDELADVHLGRFIDVIHSKSYQDQITLGIGVRDAKVLDFDPDSDGLTFLEGDIRAEYRFKSTRRTQDIGIESPHIGLGSFEYDIRKMRTGQYSYRDSFLAVIVTNLPRPRGLFMEFFPLGEPTRFQSYYRLRQFQDAVQNELQSTLYLGPFRQPPQRSYPTRGASPTEVGTFGESTITLIANEVIQSRSRGSLDQINDWLNYLKIGENLDVRRIPQSDLFDIRITLEDDNAFPLPDLGYGTSQVLPVLAQCSYCQPKSTLLFEQPGLHLHSIAARGLASVFIETAKQKHCNIVAETHSPDLLRQMQRELRDGNISIDDVAAYKVDRYDSSSHIRRIPIGDDDYDILDSWEDGLTRPHITNEITT